MPFLLDNLVFSTDYLKIIALLDKEEVYCVLVHDNEEHKGVIIRDALGSIRVFSDKGLVLRWDKTEPYGKLYSLLEQYKIQCIVNNKQQ